MTSLSFMLLLSLRDSSAHLSRCDSFTNWLKNSFSGTLEDPLLNSKGMRLSNAYWSRHWSTRLLDCSSTRASMESLNFFSSVLNTSPTYCISTFSDVRMVSRSLSSGVHSSKATVFLKSDSRADAQPELRLSELSSIRSMFRLISTALICVVFSRTSVSFSTNTDSSSDSKGEASGLIMLMKSVWFSSASRSLTLSILPEASMLLTLK
ncbi:hypothetical protein OGATHE_001249 [Ogataea polymorpha]|uniref:Secreted protein n=1 Tax=Ogataea polymorpha TaxID=460523 RepID=A0A9P8TFD6_9ASCO|nr:hypothetical protein OGATHE_001249 [Ogataea polymorpha]